MSKTRRMDVFGSLDDQENIRQGFEKMAKTEEKKPLYKFTKVWSWPSLDGTIQARGAKTRGRRVPVPPAIVAYFSGAIRGVSGQGPDILGYFNDNDWQVWASKMDPCLQKEDEKLGDLMPGVLKKLKLAKRRVACYNAVCMMGKMQQEVIYIYICA